MRLAGDDDQTGSVCDDIGGSGLVALGTNIASLSTCERSVCSTFRLELFVVTILENMDVKTFVDFKIASFLKFQSKNFSSENTRWCVCLLGSKWTHTCCCICPQRALGGRKQGNHDEFLWPAQFLGGEA